MSGETGFVDEVTANTIGPHEFTHYTVLGVTRDAELPQIKEAYHKAARTFHPDKQLSTPSPPQDEEAFLRIQRAWECLRDRDLRKAYDEKLAVAAQRGRSKKHNAIPIEREDCVAEEVLDEEGTAILVMVFTCRCGHELDIDPVDMEDSRWLECPGCSLAYDTKPLQG